MSRSALAAMSPRFKRRLLWTLLPILLLFAFAGAWYLWHRPPPDVREFSSIAYEWQTTIPGGITEAEKDQRANRCLEIARNYPGSIGGLAALLTASATAPDTPAGKAAYRELAQQVETADVGNLAEALGLSYGPLQNTQRLVPAILARVRQVPDHPRAARLLAAVCRMTNPGDEGEPPAEYKEAADLIADRYAGSPDIAHFCEGLGGCLREGPPWAGRFEKHLRTILEQNRDRWVRCIATIALADVVQHSSEDRQPEAEALFEEFRSEFDGKHAYIGQMVEGQLHDYAGNRLKELRARGIGKAAPEIAGIDLDDRPLTLSEYRGRVVLLNFWATWCMPCMKLIPHEVALAARFQGQPFTIVGVNCDSDVEKARAAVAKNKMTWRSFRDQTDQGRAVTSHWKVLGYPTLYLLDHHGIIRKRWVGGPPDQELQHTVGVLVSAAQRQAPLEEMKTVVAALQLPPAAPNAAPSKPRLSAERRPGTGFLDKLYREPNGSESKYVVFLPRTYDGSKPFPAILFLHGSGARGDDGRLPVHGGLAKAIRDRNEDFPFLVIFPQAHEGEDWTAGSAGGERAVNILNQVMKDYRIDADQVSLTGVSMGGQGTWSLAAADPQRWAAIVPVCHGGNTKTAARLKDVPCWCIHGDADKMIPIQQSREMVQAIKDAGGRPLFQELSGVDHNACVDRAYAIPDLIEWLLQQNRRRQ